MKIYLAGPMRGYPEHNFPMFNRVAAKLRAEGHVVFNPAEKGEEATLAANPLAIDSLEFRRKVFGIDTAWIATHAEMVALLPRWDESRGAVAEHALASAIGIPRRYLSEEFVQ